jgi:hypothetical protein
MTKPIGKSYWYFERVEEKTHPRNLIYNFDGSWTETKEIIRTFGERQGKLLADKDRFRYYPVLNMGPTKVVADFKYCYEEIQEHVRGAVV